MCFNGDCRDNAASVKYVKSDKALVVLESDGFIVPIENGDHFTLKSAEIQGRGHRACRLPSEPRKSEAPVLTTPAPSL